MNRTLVIGLGSTGRDVCDNLIERVEWGHTRLENMPQFDVMVLETEQRDDIPSVRTGKFISLAADQQVVTAMVDKPHNWDASLNLSRWLDGSVIPRTLNPMHGAGGCRMAGRLLLFNPATYSLVRSAFEAHLKQLRAVTIEKIREKQPEIPSNTTLNGNIRVVIVGTLCGGTASGT